MTDKLVVRTSDRATFKKCRQLWDFSSKIRLNYDTDKPIYHLLFGTAWHAAMEVLYLPGDDYQTDVRTKAAHEAFEATIREQYRDVVRMGNDSPELDKEFDEMHVLGHKMITYYAGWAKFNDDFEPVTVEHEFEVPIDWKGNLLTVGGAPIVYQGRIDGLVRDLRGYYWVLEHKSAAKEQATWWLQINDQVSSYEWALQGMLNIPIKGTIYTIAFKRAPEKPKVLKDGSVSCDRRQTTTASLFVEAIEEAHPFRPAFETITDNKKYFEYHQFLTNPDVAPKFIERHMLHRNPHQLEDVERRIAMEAQDMLNDPFIYPTVTAINCSSCPFKYPCLTRQDGGDWQYELASEYRKRSDD